MSDSIQTSEQPQSMTQRRRWLKTRFVFGRRHLDYSLESRNEAALGKTLAWDTVASRSAYFTSIEPDREVSWLAFLMTGLAAFAVLRGGQQPAMFVYFFYLGATALAISALCLTWRIRQVAFTGIPAADGNILVLQDRSHDRVVAMIESHRAAELRILAEPDATISLRAYLRRLRWLAENDVLTEQDAAARRKLMLPDELAISPRRRTTQPEPQSFRQRRFGMSISVELLADRLTYRSRQLLGATTSSSFAYRDLPQPAALYRTDHQYVLTWLMFAWPSLAVLAWATSAVQSHPENYYVGAPGFPRAIADFGPALLVMLACCAIASMLTRLRFAEPYPGIVLLHGRSCDAILAAIEERRVAALRALAEPDPLLTTEEQLQVLSGLRDAELIGDEDFNRAAKRAAFVCGNLLLDAPADLRQRSSRQKTMH